MLDVNDLIKNENFLFGDYIWTRSGGLSGYFICNGKIDTIPVAEINGDDITDIFTLFMIDAGGTTAYAGGESSAHSSCGFFYKETAGNVDWILMSTNSEPFVSCEINGKDVTFLSASKQRWIVRGGDVSNVYVPDRLVRP